jgi:hypothetical protein
VQGGFFLRKKPLEVSGFSIHQLENRYIVLDSRLPVTTRRIFFHAALPLWPFHAFLVFSLAALGNLTGLSRVV